MSHWDIGGKMCLFVSPAQQTITILPMATCRLPLSLELAPLLLDSFRMKGYEGIRENIGTHLTGPQIHMYSLYKTHTPLPTASIIDPISPFLHNVHIIRALAWELCLTCGFRVTEYLLDTTPKDPHIANGNLILVSPQFASCQ